YHDTGLTENVTYTYRLEAYNISGSTFSSYFNKAPVTVVTELNDDFNDGIDSGEWIAITAGSAFQASPDFPSGKVLWFSGNNPRQPYTSPADLMNEGFLEFDFRMGNYEGDRSGPPGHVRVECTTDGGDSWETLVVLDGGYTQHNQRARYSS